MQKLNASAVTFTTWTQTATSLFFAKPARLGTSTGMNTPDDDAMETSPALPSALYTMLSSIYNVHGGAQNNVQYLFSIFYQLNINQSFIMLEGSAYNTYDWTITQDTCILNVE